MFHGRLAVRLRLIPLTGADKDPRGGRVSACHPAHNPPRAPRVTAMFILGDNRAVIDAPLGAAIADRDAVSPRYHVTGAVREK